MTETEVGEVDRSCRRNQRGSASIETIGMLPYLLMAALFAWQVLVAGFIAVNAENAARNGSRVEGRGGDGSAAAIDSLAPFVRDGATASVDGERATVRVEIPIVLPQITSENFAITRTATLPSTD
ncbi:MAG: TadE/TadG family type IV pilus assembly protein [Actinomycetota bacterium]